MFCSQFTDEFLATVVLVHLENILTNFPEKSLEPANLGHVPVPGVDIEPSRLHLPLDPPQLHHLWVLGLPLASPAVVLYCGTVVGGAVVVMSPGLGVPSVGGAAVVVAGSVLVVGRLIAPPRVKIF